MLTHSKLTLFMLVCTVPGSHHIFFYFIQDVMYQSLHSVVDWFREAVGIPMEKKYNSVLFGGLLERSGVRRRECSALPFMTP